jgi:hypothetical protein
MEFFKNMKVASESLSQMQPKHIRDKKLYSNMKRAFSELVDNHKAFVAFCRVYDGNELVGTWLRILIIGVLRYRNAKQSLHQQKIRYLNLRPLPPATATTRLHLPPPPPPPQP